ncbi:hemolysin [Sporosarcina sp. P20a]|uniref:hemolysin n=1 Tax=Sporosarcina sp. P20a TaxID=2048256 RepID=UPI000C166C57|nr:hemolysin [Sporosarcina sp. P20a]PIC87991.1 hemolysin [Sporosarcina sp. P20a]
MAVEISEKALQKLSNYIDNQVVSADYTIDSITRPIGMRRSIISGSVVKKHVYLTTKDPTGFVTRVRLYDKDGDVFVTLTDRVEHKERRGRLFEFIFDVSIGEGTK